MSIRPLVDKAKHLISGRDEATTTANVGAVMVPVGSRIVGEPGGPREIESPRHVFKRGGARAIVFKAGPIEAMIKRLHKMRDRLPEGTPKGFDKAFNEAIGSLVKLQRQLRGS